MKQKNRIQQIALHLAMDHCGRTMGKTPADVIRTAKRFAKFMRKR